MEALFQNQCKYSKVNLLEMARATKATLQAIFCALSIFLFLSAAAIYYIYQNYVLAFELLFMVLFFVVLYFFLPYMLANKMLKHYRELYHAEVETNVLFFDDSILVINQQTKRETKKEYRQIAQILQTKICIF